jgi:hydrophobe/amphiphile efflux-1 (HAE1) family protein
MLGNPRRDLLHQSRADAMISKFFIDRPVFSSVLSIIIVLVGIVSIVTLPVAQFPEITPPSVQVAAQYQGASAETVSASVAAPIEQQLSGAENLMYYQSQSANDGTMALTATFEIGSNQDLAAVDVQNRLSLATPRLPQDVMRTGVTVTKQSTAMLCVAALISDDPQYDELFLSNYATINLLDAVKRVPGVGDAMVFGSRDYAMRIWVDPDRMTQRDLTVTDVVGAIQDQNEIFAAGRIGQEPTAPGKASELTMSVLTEGRLDEPEQYQQIILRANQDGSIIRLNDIATVDLGSQSYDLFGRLNGTPTTLLVVYLQVGANALSTINGVRNTLDELSQSFPRGVRYAIPYDTTRFVEVSINEVIHTLAEAVVLVLLVVFVFLQSWRATLIPLLAVPVSIIGTFAGMLALGFSINTLTLFGMVLAIGIVVDDAIVVVENVERIMHEKKLPVREATIEAMNEVSGPIIAIVLVLSAVFLPVAFLGGLTGELYRQFAVTIAVSVAISGLVALTLSPAMCRLLLKPSHGRKFILFRWFNSGFDKFTAGYTHTVRMAIRLAIVSVLIFAVIGWAAWHLFQIVPGGFIPDEDQGYIVCVTVLPDGASLSRTKSVIERIEQYFRSQPETADVVVLGGFDFLGGGVNSTNAAAAFVCLKPWDQRREPQHHAPAVIARAWQALGSIQEAMILTFNPPAIQGLGQRSGFEFQLQMRGGSDIRQLATVTQDFMAKARQRPELMGLNSTLRVNTPQIYVDLDRDAIKTMGVPVSDVFNSLQAFLGALYVNDFDKFGRIWKVQLQAAPQFRSKPEDISRIYVRNTRGEMVPLSAVISAKYQSGPNIVSRFNGFPSVQITGAPAPGHSTGQSMQVMEELGAELPAGFGYEWSGASLQEIRAGNQAPLVMGFGLLVVFLVLAAQYEAWSLPLAVMFAVPLGIFGALLAVHLRGINNDIYFQIGLLTLIGLAAKNAILIVEFCVVLRREGKTIVEAAIEAARLRLRPILMTSLAFILGVVPLVVSDGAGAASRHSIGTGVMGGMLAATFLAVFFVPLFFVLIQRSVDGLRRVCKIEPGLHDSTGPARQPIAAETSR